MALNQYKMWALFLLLGFVGAQQPDVDRTSTDALGCNYPSNNPPHRRAEICFVKSCNDAIKEQIKHELSAAFSYLYLAAYFDDVTVSRPGLAKFLYESASEERAHAISMLEYLDRRGAVFEMDYSFEVRASEYRLQKDPGVFYKSATGKYTYEEALKIALEMEMEVTKKINNVVTACTLDYDGADFFTQPILAEQFDGQRKLTGAINTLSDMIGREPNQSPLASEIAFAEYVFDQRVLKNGL